MADNELGHLHGGAALDELQQRGQRQLPEEVDRLVPEAARPSAAQPCEAGQPVKLRRPGRIGGSPVVVDQEPEPATGAIANRQSTTLLVATLTMEEIENARQYRSANWA